MKSGLPGISVVGFFGLFEADYGDPTTPRPYPRVTPTRVGSALLPFHCPRCVAVVDFSDEKRCAAYSTKRNGGHSWCPSCGGRFHLNPKGRPLAGPLDALGAAPALIERVVRDEVGALVEREVISGTPARSRSLTSYLAGCDLVV